MTRTVNYAVYADAGFSSAQIDALGELLEKSKIHWLSLNPNTGIFDMVVDNVILSAFRACPMYGIEAFVRGIGSKGRDWNLDFGIVFHDAMKYYYTNFRNSDFNMEKFVKLAGQMWMDNNMKIHNTHKGFADLGGLLGFGGLLVQYVQRFGPENERLRVIGTEIAFGHNKEVPIGSVSTLSYHKSTGYKDESRYYDNPWLNLYLSGRMDLLVDDGTAICPLDHKTKTSFKRDITLEYSLDEGPTGYVYAVNKILPKVVSDPALLKRNSNKIIMNFILKGLPKDGDRFRRINMMKTQEDLANYEQRMLSSAEYIFRNLVLYASGGTPFRDTSKCTNWYMHDCPYLAIHRQNSKENEEKIIQSFYEIKPVWNTEEV